MPAVLAEDAIRTYPQFDPLNKTTTLLGEPAPRESIVDCFKKNRFSELKISHLAIPEEQAEADIFQVISRRRSNRHFASLDLNQLSKFLWFTCATRSIEQRSPPPDWEHRPFPSAGGCHATRIIVISKSNYIPTCSIYDHNAHGLRTIESKGTDSIVLDRISEVVAVQEGTLLLLACDVSRIRGRYENWESLAWRDAGVLIGGFSLVAEALGLNFCPLGISGNTEVNLLLNEDDIIGVGACILGSSSC